MPEDIQYQILRADKAGMPAVPGMIFNDPAEAAKISKRLSRDLGEKLLVRPIVNNKWRERETLRTADGTYRPIPWAAYDWWNSTMALTIWRDHYPHPSIERPGWLAYTASVEDGMKDKQTIVRPGAYLKKYFERIMDYYGVSERRSVDQFMEAYGPIEIKFATTEDEIISVYENGPDTCMKGRNWPGDKRNPAYVYAAGDLQVAYLGDLDDARARTLVWPEKKTFSRVYGDIARLTRGLERLGYKWGAPIGAKVKMVKVKEVKFNPNKGPPTGCFIIPYIDKMNQRGGGHLSVKENADHLVICAEGEPGSHHCGLPDGFSGQYVPRDDEYPTFTCDRCSVPGFRELTVVYTDAEASVQESWCHKCCRHAFQCGYSDDMFSSDSVLMVVVEGLVWNKHYADMYAARCAMTGILVNQANMHDVHFADGTIKKVSRDWCQRNGGIFQSYISKRIYMKTEMVKVRTSYEGLVSIGKPELRYHTFQCDSCDLYSSLKDRIASYGDDRLFCYVCHDKIRQKYPVPVSPSRLAFEAKRDQYQLIAAE